MLVSLLSDTVHDCAWFSLFCMFPGILWSERAYEVILTMLALCHTTIETLNRQFKRLTPCSSSSLGWKSLV